MKKFILSALVSFTTTTSIAKPTPITFWHSMAGSRGKLMGEIIADFNRTHADKIRVEPQFIGTYVEGINKLRTSFMGGSGPHIVQVYEIGTQTMLDSQTVEPLQNIVDSEGGLDFAQLYEPILRYYRIKGRLYSLPFATSSPLFYYNTDLFRQAGIKSAPKTFAEVMQYARRLTNPKKKIKGITWPLHGWFFEQFMAKQGALIVNHANGRERHATKALFSSPEGVAFVSFWSDLLKQGLFDNVGRGWAPAEQNFVAGRTAMFITSSSNMFDVVTKAEFPVGTATLFSGNSEKKGGVLLGGNCLWLLKGKPRSEQVAAYQFIKFMASKDVQRRWHLNTGYFPIRRDVVTELTQEGFYRKNPQALTALNQLLDAPKIPATQGALIGVFPAVREYIETAVEEVLTERSNPKEALEKAERRANKALARYNRMFRR